MDFNNELEKILTSYLYKENSEEIRNEIVAKTENLLLEVLIEKEFFINKMEWEIVLPFGYRTIYGPKIIPKNNYTEEVLQQILK